MKYLLLLVSVLIVACEADQQAPVSAPDKMAVEKAEVIDAGKLDNSPVKKYPLLPYQWN